MCFCVVSAGECCCFDVKINSCVVRLFRRVASVTCGDVFCRRVACYAVFMGRECGRLSGLVVDGICGKLTVAGLQRFLRAEGVFFGVIDGVVSVELVEALQVFINKGGWYR